MKLKITALLCCAVIFAVLLTACSGASDNNGKNTSATTKPEAVYFTDEGYQLPYSYDDGYKAYLKVADKSEYETQSTVPTGGKVVHLTTELSEDEVRAYYEEYFKTLMPVKAKKETDKSVAYYDAENRLVVFNLYVWTVDGVTNYKLGSVPCDDIEKDSYWVPTEE